MLSFKITSIEKAIGLGMLEHQTAEQDSAHGNKRKVLLLVKAERSNNCEREGNLDYDIMMYVTMTHEAPVCGQAKIPKKLFGKKIICNSRMEKY